MSDIIGIGTDMVALARIDDLHKRFGEKFTKRILSAKELPKFNEHASPVAFLAKRFAAKEAVTKALGTGIGEMIGFHDITVLNRASGQPFVEYDARVKSFLEQLNVNSTHISLSDEKDYALAFVVVT